MKLKDAVDKYLNTRQFNSLSISSQKNYEYNLASFCRMSIMGKTLGDVRVTKINTEMCIEIYDTWEAETSTSNANHNARVFSVLMNYLVTIDVVPYNPMARVKKRSSEPRSVIWTHEQVEKFLDVSFTKFEYRSIGLIVLMCYEWGQRPVDIRNLTWDDVDLDKRVVTIKQSKRGAVVELPIPDNLYPMLKQQAQDLDFQQYVVPHHRPQDNAYRPITVSQMTALLSEVKAIAGLPDDLRVGDLRKTAIVQMIESGVDHLAIQSVSGHKSVASLNPYNKFSLKTAKSALDRRQRQ
jgi:integrase